MKIVFVSNSGESLPIAYRLRQEGTDASVYLHNPAYRNNYEGLVPKLNLVQLKRTIRQADLVVFDITRPNEKTKQDVALLKMFGLKSSSPSVFGPVADKLRKSVKVIGCGTICEEIELGRAKGVELAEKMGFAIPETHSFKTLFDGVKFLKAHKNDMWVFKPEKNQDLDLTYVEKLPGELITKLEAEYKERLGEKIDFILQKKLDGVELSSEVWIGPKGPVHFNHTLENKRLMDGNLGPAIGSQSNTVWIENNPDGICVQQLKQVAEYLQRAGYVGPCDTNCIIAEDKKPYFLEYSPRMGYDAIYCLLSLVKGRLTDFFAKDFAVEFHGGFASSERISIPPFPYADSTLLKEYARDVSILNRLENLPQFWAEDVYLKNGRLACAGADGILGVVAARGNSLGGAWGSVYRAIEQLKVCSYLQHRLDGHKSLSKRYETLQKWGLVNG